MSRKTSDIERSLKRHLALHLDEDYDVRLETDGGAFERPAVMVATLPQVSDNQRRYFTITQPFTLYGYPEKGVDPFDAQDKGRALEDTLITAIEVGGQGGHPRRIPIYDYDGVARDEALEDPSAEGYAWVEDVSAEHRTDPEDELLRTVVVEIRLRWRRLGQQPEGGLTAQTVGVGYLNHPERAGTAALSGGGEIDVETG